MERQDLTQVQPTLNYADRFQAKDEVASYESKEYAAGSYSSRIWQLQLPQLQQIFRSHQAQIGHPIKLLDFACGTGRVLSRLEPEVASADGVDISPEMLAVAQKRCTKARLQVGDILSQPELLQQDYDVITAFRFLLNVEPELRLRVLRRLREVISVPNGVLVINVHGNSRSLRHPAILWRRSRERQQKTNTMLNEMSPAETRQLFRDSGFEIVRQYGFGVLPPSLYRTPVRGLAFAIDNAFAGDRAWNNWAVDMLFVCRPV